MASTRMREPAPVRWGLRLVAVGYVFLLVAWPIVAGGQEHLRRRPRPRCHDALTDPDVVHALQLTADRGASRPC